MIDSFYAGKTLLVTGTTGFVGKVLIEKLLFSLPQIKRIYIFIRPRKGSSIQERFRKEIIESACFDRIRDTNPSILTEKILPIQGDLLKSPVIFDPREEQEVLETVNIIMNSAASVDFNQRLDQAIQINVLGTLKILDLAKRCKNLSSFVQISTCYVNCDKPQGWIEEKVYPISRDYRELLNEIMSLSVQDIERKTAEYVGTYPNTYTFTKNLCEQFLQEEAGKFPMCIVRPSIIAGSLKQPTPGWVDTVSASGAVYLSSGLGLVSMLKGDVSKIGDQIPVDLVVNSVICAAALYCKPGAPFVVHSASSSRNPIPWGQVAHYAVAGLIKYLPEKSAVSKPSLILTQNKYRLGMFKLVKRKIPLFLYKTLGNVTKDQNIIKNTVKLEKLLRKEDVIAESFKHFTNFEWIFSCQNLIGMQKMMTPDEVQRFELDPAVIEWKSYILSFIYGLKKFVLKEEIYSELDVQHSDLNWDIRSESRFSDILWAYNGGDSSHHRKASEMRNLILRSQRVQQKILDLSTKSKGKSQKDVSRDLNRRAEFLLKTIMCDLRMPVVRVFAWVLRKLWRIIYEKVVIDHELIKTFKSFVSQTKDPIVLVPTHRSIIDFLMVSYIVFAYNMKMPFIASSKDFMQLALINHVLRRSGAFFVQKNINTDELYLTLLTEYVQQLLKDSEILEFFIEGTRSRSGKCLPPRLGLLSICTDAYFDGQVGDIHFVPITINYERVLEGEAFLLELVGEKQPQESLTRMLSSLKILKQNLGKIYMNFGNPISIKNFSGEMKEASAKSVNHALGYEIVHRLQEKVVIMATSIVSAVLLMHRRVILEEEIIKKVEWIRNEIQARNFKVGGIDSGSAQVAVRNALAHLSQIVAYRKDLFQPSVCANSDFKSVLLLSYYRNALITVFAKEAIIVATLYSFGEIISSEEGISESRLIEESVFLGSLLKDEFIIREDLSQAEALRSVIDYLVRRQILKKDSDKVRFFSKAEIATTFFCSLLWPLIDTYWATMMFCSAFRKRQAIHAEKLQHSIQWFLENMYEERTISFYESCSYEYISNALSSFEKRGILKKEENLFINLTEEYSPLGVLEDMLERIDKFRKKSLVKKLTTNHELRDALLSEFPDLPKI
jgi:glycerone phosphate O-acyltransferase/fatty acyl-CoA reductase